MRLGLARIRAVVMNQHVVGGMRDACPPGFHPNRYWQGALATSVAAGDLGRRLLPSQADDAITAGLLCDIGVSLMAFAIPPTYAKVLSEYAKSQTASIDDIERRVLGVSHAEIGAAILTDWQLEEHLIVAVGRHHNLPDAPCPDDGTARFARIVAAAAVCSRLALAGSDMEHVECLFRQLDGLTPNPDALVGDVLDQLVSHIKETADSLAVELGETNELAANLADAVRGIPDCSAAMSTRPMDSPVMRQ
jgi:HD-like signal output (HDOD) protein